MDLTVAYLLVRVGWIVVAIGSFKLVESLAGCSDLSTVVEQDGIVQVHKRVLAEGTERILLRVTTSDHIM